MNTKKKLAVFLSIITIITFLGTVVLAEPIHVPPKPIRDSIVEEF